MVGLTSAAGVVGFLAEPDLDLKVFALKKLDEQIDWLWTEVAGSVGDIEALYEDETFPKRELAALVAAKVYYNLQEYNESMVFALGAGRLFDIDRAGEFEDTIISKCVDRYIALSAAKRPDTSVDAADQSPSQLVTSFPAQGKGAASTSAGLASPTTPFSQSTLPSKSLLSRQDSIPAYDTSAQKPTNDSGEPQLPPLPINIQKQLHAVIERLFERCYQEGAYRQVVGIAIEARNLEKLRQAILRAKSDQAKGKGPQHDALDQSDELMEYVLEICMGIVQERGLRNEILRLILDLLNDTASPEYFSIAKCIVYLNEHEMASNVLIQLVEKDDPKLLAIAYQIAFDIYDNSTQDFLKKVRTGLPAEPEDNSGEDGADLATETDALLGNPDTSTNGTAGGHEHKAGMNGKPPDAQNHEASATAVRSNYKEPSSQAKKAFASIADILRGTKTIELNLEFLYRNNRTDKQVLNKIKDSLEARNSIFHTAVSLANAFMHAGTTNDRFFRDNLEWLGKAVNWSKFTATAALGVIHRGNLGQGQKLLEPYLPKGQIAGANAGSAYSQGGSLYALGLIYANHETFALDLIRKHFNEAQDEVVQHGGALGLGVAGMATGDEDIYEDLKKVLWADSALNGEAVGISIGLIMLGTGNAKVLDDLLQYAHETQHEKIVRGIALGVALISYARQEAADGLINFLLNDADPILRYGGILTIALAYCGTGSNKAVRRLLHVAVSDVSDDVRRIAVLSLGFVLFRKPTSVPRMVELLAESYNPHVRYGAALALGISCAGTGLDEAIDLLEPMIKDPTDFVRQGALIALAMIMVEQNEVMNPKVGTVRKTLQKAISDRHEDAMTKFGSAVALGIIDAGGRNCTIGLQTQTGNLHMAAIVGMAVFTQYWYWFPLTHFLSLTFQPTAVVAVDQDLEAPSFKFHSATRPSLFDYPPEQEAKVEDAPEKVKTAVLSTTAQAKRRAQKKERAQRRESMDVDPARMEKTSATPAPEDRMDTDEPTVKTEKEDSVRPEETPGPATKEGEERKDGAAAAAKKKIEKEKVGYDMENMSRVLPAQLRYLSFPDGRYEPIKKPTGGVILVIDKQPSEPKTLMELKARKGVKQTAAAPDPTGAARAPDAAAVGAATAGAGGAGLGAAEAAGVLTAIDEDIEGDEEAPVPQDFEYESEGGGEE